MHRRIRSHGDARYRRQEAERPSGTVDQGAAVLRRNWFIVEFEPDAARELWSRMSEIGPMKTAGGPLRKLRREREGWYWFSWQGVQSPPDKFLSAVRSRIPNQSIVLLVSRAASLDVQNFAEQSEVEQREKIGFL